MAKASGRELLFLYMACRDDWHDMQPLTKARNKGHAAFTSWILDVWADWKKGNGTPSMHVQTLLSQLTGGFDPQTYTLEDIRIKICSNSQGRNYRICCAADVRHDEKGYRVRNMLEAMYKSKEVTLKKWGSLRCPFFRDRGEATPLSAARPTSKTKRS